MHSHAARPIQTHPHKYSSSTHSTGRPSTKHQQHTSPKHKPMQSCACNQCKAAAAANQFQHVSSAAHPCTVTYAQVCPASRFRLPAANLVRVTSRSSRCSHCHNSSSCTHTPQTPGHTPHRLAAAAGAAPATTAAGRLLTVMGRPLAGTRPISWRHCVLVSASKS